MHDICMAAMSGKSFPEQLEAPAAESDDESEDLFGTNGSSDDSDSDFVELLEENDMLGLPENGESTSESVGQNSKQCKAQVVTCLEKAAEFRSKASMLGEKANWMERKAMRLLKQGARATESAGSDVPSLPLAVKPDIIRQCMEGKVCFSCSLCSSKHKSWSGADSHVRKKHTLIQYGPCETCSFKTFNVDSFRNHQKRQTCRDRPKFIQTQMNKFSPTMSNFSFTKS